jgi:hypothetical protein
MIIRKFENFQSGDILLIVDVQKSFKKYFSEMYLNELNKYCKTFGKVYQIWDNHSVEDSDNDYLWSHKPTIPITGDLYKFPNQVDLIEKRYNYNVNIDFYKKLLDTETFNRVKELESSGKLKIGDSFKTKWGTILTFIDNNHKWFHCGKKLLNLLESLSGKEIVMVGGSLSECFRDIEITAKSLGVIVKIDYKYTWSPNHSYL